jgi:hypothetical protein
MTEKAQEGVEFEVDDWVEWTHVGGSGRSISMAATAGPIKEIKGDKARVRRGKNGKKDYWIPLKSLGKPGDRRGTKPIRNFVAAMAGRSEPL